MILRTCSSYVVHWLAHHARCPKCHGAVDWQRPHGGLHSWAALHCGEVFTFEFDRLPRLN